MTTFVKWVLLAKVFLSVFNRNEDRDERNRKASYDVKEGTSDCEDWWAKIPAQQCLTNKQTSIPSDVKETHSNVLMFSAAQSPRWRRCTCGGSRLISWCAVQLGGTLSGNFSAPSSARRTCCSGSHVRSSAKRPIKVWSRRRPGSSTRTTSPFSRRKRCETFIDLYFGKIEFPWWVKPCDVWVQWVYQCHFQVVWWSLIHLALHKFSSTQGVIKSIMSVFKSVFHWTLTFTLIQQMTKCFCQT